MWILGDDLETWLEREPDWQRRVSMFRRIALALAQLHARGLVHGSFDAHAVVIDSDDEPRLLVGAGPTPNTTAAVPVLTRECPVVLADEMSDQIAFGRTMRDALLGHGQPWCAQTRAVSQSRRRVAAVLERATRTTTVARWASMTDLAEALERSLHETGDGRRGWIVSALVGLGLLAAVRPMLAAERGSSCAADSLRVHAAWMGAPRERVTAALAADSRAFVPELERRLDVALTDYADRWSSAWQTTCEGAEVQPPVSQGSRSCLEDAALRFESYVAYWGRGESGAVEKIPDALAALPPPESCGQRRAVEDAEFAARANRGLAWIDVGADREATKLLEDADARARRLRVVSASVERLRGRLAAAAGDRTLAEVSYARAFDGAMAAREDGLATSVAREQCTLIASDRTRGAEAMVWCDVALTLVDRTNDPSSIEHTRLLEARASVLMQIEAPVAAAEVLEDALEREAVAKRRDGVLAGRLHRSLARVRRDLAQPKLARTSAERAVAIHEMLLGARHPEVVVLQFELGHYYRNEGNHRGALDAYQRVLAATEADPLSDLASTKEVLLALSDMYSAEDRLDEARAASARAARTSTEG